MVAVLDVVATYKQGAILAPYVNSKYAVLADPGKFEYSLFGQTTYVREITGGNAGNYTTSGYRPVGKSGTSVRTPFVAPYDRSMTDSVDALAEFNALLQGEVPNIVLITQRTWARFGAEMDALITANLYAVAKAEDAKSVKAVPNLLKVEKSDLKTPTLTSGLYGQLTDVKNAMFDEGYSGRIFVFGSTDYMAALTKSITNAGYGLANQSLLNLANSSDIQLPEDVRDKLSMNPEIGIYDDMYLIKVPKSRMYSHVTLLDGVSSGQEDGGYIPTAKPVDDILQEVAFTAVPYDGVAVSVRHLVANMLLPQVLTDARGFNVAKLETDINLVDQAVQDSNQALVGRFEIQNIGVNQKANAFEMSSRIVWGLAVFQTYKKYIRVATITETAGA